MSHVLTLAAREFHERRNVALAGLALGLIGLPLPLLFASYAPAATRGAYLFMTFGSFVPAAALMLGASVVGRDLNERRLGFYFTRPVSGLAIVAGKLLGGVAVLIAATLALTVPPLVAGTELVDWGLKWAEPVQLLTLFAAGLATLLLLGHAGSVAGRSHSAWLALDVAVLAAVIATGVATGQRLARAWATTPFAWAIGTLAVGFALALAAAAVTALLRERTDHARVHRAQSLLFAALALPLALGVALYARWVLTPGPADFAPKAIVRATGSGWIDLAGDARSAGAAMLWDPATGRVVRRQAGAWRTTFSADGRMAAWVEPDGRGERQTLAIADLDGAHPVPQETSVALPGSVCLEFSPDGRRLAALAEDNLQVLELPSMRLVATARIPGVEHPQGWRSAVRFVAGGRVRAWLAGSTAAEREMLQVTIAELDPEGHKLEVLGAFAARFSSSTSVSADGNRLVTHEKGEGERLAVLRDGKTGASLAVLARAPHADGQGELGRVAAARFTTDGRLALLELTPEGARLRILDRDGAEQHVLDPFPGASVPRLLSGFDLGPEARPGLLAVGTRPGAERAEARFALVDLATGTIRRSERGLSLRSPARGDALWSFLERGQRPWAPVTGSLPVWSDSRTLVAYDPDRGGRAPLLALRGKGDDR